MSLVLINYGHFLGLAALFAGLAVELTLFRPRVDGRTARKLARADLVCGLAALLILVTGLLKIFAGDKPAAYYGHNPLFHIKMTVFVIVLLMSILPAVKFVGQRKAADDAQVDYPAVIGTLLRIELLVIVFIPLLAVLMARGYGFGG